jgi:RimJ/RimL family protein N-acetyltransferase
MILLDNRPIGECSLLEKADSGEIGIMLFPTYWRIGYGTEAVKLLTALAEELKLKTLTATTSRMNVSCIRLLQKMGFQETAIGWMVDEEKIDDSGPLKELFGTVMFEKTI